MTDDTRPTALEMSPIGDTHALPADQISPAATVDAMFDDRDRDLEVLHWVKRRSQVSLCGITDNWNRIGAQSGPASTSPVCPLCETLRAMSRQLDMTGLEQMPPR